MKVTLVSLQPTEASLAAGRPALTPELLAASGARYSRSNEGLDAILAKIDPKNLDKSVDSIFRMIDYGHQSIADMAPVSMFIDGLSIYLAYYVWTLCPTAGGQESSTRYIRLDEDGLIAPEILGIPDASLSTWRSGMQAAFRAYREAVKMWEEIAAADPSVARIPQSLRDDPSDKARRAVARMNRNYAFDRARYFLPIAASTNMMLVMSARAWVTLIQHLLSHPLPEAQAFGAACRDELGLAAPRLLRHARAQPSLVTGLQREFEAARRIAQGKLNSHAHLDSTSRTPTADANAALDVFAPSGTTGAEIATDLRDHDNRYAYLGETLRRTAVRFSWSAVALAEIRDLNRHRTGTKYCPPVPQGFYYAADQLPVTSSGPVRESYTLLAATGRTASQTSHNLLSDGDPTYVYHALLGTQFPFEHTTTADKFLYEAELRTGTGAHYRYAKHLHDALELWYAKFPETRGLVLEGSAEPE